MSKAVTWNTVASAFNVSSAAKAETEEEPNKNTMCWNYHFTSMQSCTKQPDYLAVIHFPSAWTEGCFLTPRVLHCGVSCCKTREGELWEFHRNSALWNINMKDIHQNRILNSCLCSWLISIELFVLFLFFNLRADWIIHQNFQEYK